MGPQPSALNCKVNQTDKQSQIIASKQFAVKKNKGYASNQQPNISDHNFPTQNVIGVKSPRNQLTRSTSEQNISSKSSRQTAKPKRFLPEHQAITKVSETPFKQSVKQKNLYVEQKTKTLGEIVESRYNTSKHLPYSQILSLAQTLVYGLAYLSKKNCNHHDFYPMNIYYNEGKFKIINPLQLQASGFYLTSQRQRFSFLSPELIIAILQEKTQTEVGQQMMAKSDVFAIGMILLQTCSLQPSSECYDEQSYNIVDSIIKQRIVKTSKVYTPAIAQCINFMLQYEFQQRVNASVLAQLVHSKIQNEKQIAMQLQAPKIQGPPTVNPQSNRGIPRTNMMQPNTMQPLPQHMIPRGPHPPPYNKQPFKLQNLNENVIAVSVPNQVYTRISPNNQGFLSSSSLQQKLRVIELIKQNPNEDDSEGQNDAIIFKQVELQKHQAFQKAQVQKYEQIKRSQNIFQQKRNSSFQNLPIRVQYPLIQSIYSQKPLIEQSNQYDPRKNQLNTPINNSQSNYNVPQIDTSQNQGYKRQIQPQNIIQNTHKIFTQQQTRVNSFAPGQNQPLMNGFQGNLQQRKNLSPNNNYAYVTSGPVNPSKMSPISSNVYNTRMPGQDLPKNSGNMHQSTFSGQKDSGFSHKYGTSFQNKNTSNEESLQQRVQRVLNMSRNAK